MAWAFGIAVYEVKTLCRQVQRRREDPADGLRDRATADPTPEDATIRRDLHQALAVAVGELTPAEREALLGEAPDASSPISPPTWRKRRQRALDRLRAVWKGRHG